MPTLKKWRTFSAPKLGAPNLSFKKSKYPHTFQVWALHNMDLNTRFHLQKGIQVCKRFGRKHVTAKIQISFVISKYLLDLFPLYPSYTYPQYYVSSKSNKSCWRTGLKGTDFLPDTHLLVRWVLGVIPCSPKRVTKTLASVPAPRTSPVTVTTS